MIWRDIDDDPPPDDDGVMIEALMPSGRVAKMSGHGFYGFTAGRSIFRAWRTLTESAAPCSVDD